MPTVVSDAVDAYVIRRINARLQFLALQRRADAPFSGAWQAVHTRILPTETAVAAAERALMEAAGLEPRLLYSADYVNQIYDHSRDVIVLAPVLAIEVDQTAQIRLGVDFMAWEWCERDEATSRFLWSGQRWAVRHIDDLIGLGGARAEFYRIQ